MDVLFHLSGEHGTLPKSELMNFIRHRSEIPLILEDLDQIKVLRLEKSSPSSFKELAMTHSVLEHVGTCVADQASIGSMLDDLDAVDGSYSVRVHRIKKYSSTLGTLPLERFVGERIKGGRVDLKDPEVSLCGYLSSDRFVFGKKILDIKRSGMTGRGPKFRPYFHPTSLTPILSRTLCNISGVISGKTVLDPFCGAGGVLIEAGLLGAEVYGIDIDPLMVEGCKKNLAHQGISGDIALGDATKIDERNFYDIVITDPPYGRSSTTKGLDLYELYKNAVASIYGALKKDGTACIISPDHIDLESIMRRCGFKILEQHSIKVHKSLVRKIIIGSEK